MLWCRRGRSGECTNSVYFNEFDCGLHGALLLTHVLELEEALIFGVVFIGLVDAADSFGQMDALLV